MGTKAPEPAPMLRAVGEGYFAVFKHDLGDRVREKISGFKGIITARVQYITGCNQYHVVKEGMGKDGKPFDGAYYDEDRLDVCGKNIGHAVLNSGGPSREQPTRG